LQPQSIALLAINFHPTQELDRELYMGIGSDGLLTSLLADARAGRTGALERIRFYYPQEYELQRAGDLKLRIEAFEAVTLNRSH
jgi:hypothetical protein